MILFRVKVAEYSHEWTPVIPALNNMSWQGYPGLLGLHRETLHREKKKGKEKKEKEERKRKKRVKEVGGEYWCRMNGTFSSMKSE